MKLGKCVGLGVGMGVCKVGGEVGEKEGKGGLDGGKGGVVERGKERVGE